MNSIPLTHILFVSTALFCIGMYGLFTRRNMITMLMSIELMLNSVNINFVAFNKYLWPEKLEGIFFTLFIITIAAAEAAIAIADVERTGKSGVSHVQVAPASAVFHTPPPTEAMNQVLPVASSGSTTIPRARPATLPGPRLTQGSGVPAGPLISSARCRAFSSSIFW